jgi:hypothetical protein
MPRKAASEEKPKLRARRPRKASLSAEPLAGRLGASGAEALLDERQQGQSRVTGEPQAVPVTAQPVLDHAEVTRLAHSYWLERGGQGGSAEEDWHRAEEALKARTASNQG